MAFREDAGLLEGDGRANASIFANDAEAAFGGAIVVRAAVEQHAASALGAILFWEHEVLFSCFPTKTQGLVRTPPFTETVQDGAPEKADSSSHSSSERQIVGAAQSKKNLHLLHKAQRVRHSGRHITAKTATGNALVLLESAK